MEGASARRTMLTLAAAAMCSIVHFLSALHARGECGEEQPLLAKLIDGEKVLRFSLKTSMPP